MNLEQLTEKHIVDNYNRRTEEEKNGVSTCSGYAGGSPINYFYRKGEVDDVLREKDKLLRVLSIVIEKFDGGYL
jgi:hypothetical protein